MLTGDEGAVRIKKLMPLLPPYQELEEPTRRQIDALVQAFRIGGLHTLAAATAMIAASYQLEEKEALVFMALTSNRINELGRLTPRE